MIYICDNEERGAVCKFPATRFYIPKKKYLSPEYHWAVSARCRCTDHAFAITSSDIIRNATYEEFLVWEVMAS
jgi:hypothetical protein